MPTYTHFKNLSFVDNLAEGAKGSEVALTASFNELNTLDGTPASVTTSATPASGSCAVQFVFKDVAGVTMAVPSSGLLYLSEASTGLTHDLADTSFAVLTNGAVTNIGGAGPSLYTTTAAGLLGLTITAAADDYYVVFVKPNGLLLISDVCTVNS
jgi:hypothetical protein